MGSSDPRVIINGLRRNVIKHSFKAPESEYYRGVFEGYAELYSEACFAYDSSASLSDLRAGLEMWARAAISSYDATANLTEYMRGIRDVAAMYITK